VVVGLGGVGFVVWVWGLGVWVLGLCRVQDSGFRGLGLGFGV
jgi:hypothetical protein